MDFAIKHNPKQKIAIGILANPKIQFVNFYGGSQSGKTFLFIYTILLRALIYPQSEHLVARFSRARAKQTIWRQCLKPLARKLETMGLCRIYQSTDDLRVQMVNGSYVLVDGLEPSRLDGVLSSKYATIFVNECREVAYSAVELLITRLNSKPESIDGKGRRIVPKFFCDLNPASKHQWPYLMFVQKINPATRKPLPEPGRYAKLWWEPKDNEENNDPNYIEQLKTLSPDAQKMYLLGEYGSPTGLVVPFSHDVHVIENYKLPPRKFRGSFVFGRAVDFGFTAPFACLWLLHDISKDVVIVYREYGGRRITVPTHAEKIRALGVLDLEPEERKKSWRFSESLYRFTVCDHDSGDRALLEEHGVLNDPAMKDRKIGIQHLIDLFDHKNKRPRVLIYRGCVELIKELESWRFRNEEEAKKEFETEGEDHYVDALRYGLVEMIPPIFGGDGITALL